MARILVVDDSASAFFFVRRELSLDGHVVEHLGRSTVLLGVTELLRYSELSPFVRAEAP